MAYSDFTLETAIASLGVNLKTALLFPGLSPITPPAWLLETFTKRTPLALISEKSRSEFIVVPILLACRELSQDKLAIYSGQRLDIDPAAGLTGECDFILSLAPAILPLRAPIITVVEAKKNDVEIGLGQCIAQMSAAQRFNVKAGHTTAPMFGCVTTGEIWQFLKLQDSVVFLDEQRYYLDNIGNILAVFQTIVRQEETLFPGV